MHSGRLALASLSLAALCCGGHSASKHPKEINLGQIEQRVFKLVNDQRHDHDRKKLHWDERLAEVARQHSSSMAAFGYFSHTDPTRGDLTQRINAAHIPWHEIGENIFEERGYPDPADRAVKSWQKSPEHRRNMLNPNFTDGGVGVAVRADGSIYITEDFAKP